jgi:hypothetical protein
MSKKNLNPFARAKAAIEQRDQTMVEQAPETDTKHARRGKALCGITAVRQGVRVTCALPIMHIGKHQCQGIEWARSGIESLVEGQAA